MCQPDQGTSLAHAHTPEWHHPTAAASCSNAQDLPLGTPSLHVTHASACMPSQRNVTDPYSGIKSAAHKQQQHMHV